MPNAWLTQSAAAAATATTQPAGDDSTAIATDAFVYNALQNLENPNGFTAVVPGLNMTNVLGTQTTASTSQRVYAMRMIVLTSVASGTRTLTYQINTAGATLSSSNCGNQAQIFSGTGTALGSSTGDQSTNWASAGDYSQSVGTFALTAGQTIYAVFAVNGTTGPKFAGYGVAGNGTTIVNQNLSAALLVAGVVGSSQTIFPTSITPSALSATNAITIACALT